MQSILTLGLITFVLTFCGLGDRLKSLTGGGSSNGTNSTSGTGSDSAADVETPTLTAS